ncbi:uncharacterized protein LOC143209835 [Lasioglossum baleicum]|uniref:uncharacterized protein LOC143209835 n=1 Tax=Lasioglossum baleicum TaxID=434251 RepID=UPI003FCC2995
MNTPILTKLQQKHSLSAKKTPAKGLRNVLAQPQDSFWPIVREAQKCSQLEQLLKKLMPAIKRPSRMIPWSELKQMTKEERSKVKLEALQKQEYVPNTEILNSVVLGLNAITRSLEKNIVSCVIMDAGIDPQLLVKHIIMMAQNKKIPILILPNFKTMVLNAIGFASAACALKDIVAKSPEHHFYQLYMKICDIFKDIPLPKNSLQLYKDSEEPLDEMIAKDGMISIENEPEVDASGPIKFTLSTDVYKYRSSRKERAFIPPNATISSNNKSTTQQTETDEFISLSNYHTDEYDTSIKKHMRYVNIGKNTYRRRTDYNVNKNVANVTYLPLKVKRLQGNSNRVKATKVSKQKKK